MIYPSIEAFRAYGSVSRWQLLFEEVRIRLAKPSEVAKALRMAVAGMTLPLMPLWEIEARDERMAAILVHTHELAARL